MFHDHQFSTIRSNNVFTIMHLLAVGCSDACLARCQDAAPNCQSLRSRKSVVDSVKDSADTIVRKRPSFEVGLDGASKPDVSGEERAREIENQLSIQEAFYVLKANIYSKVRTILTPEQKETPDRMYDFRPAFEPKVLRGTESLHLRQGGIWT